MKNNLKNKLYIKLLHSINSCKNYTQIEGLFCSIIKYCNNNIDGNDLLIKFQIKKTSLNPELTQEEISNIKIQQHG